MSPRGQWRGNGQGGYPGRTDLTPLQRPSGFLGDTPFVNLLLGLWVVLFLGLFLADLRPGMVSIQQVQSRAFLSIPGLVDYGLWWTPLTCHLLPEHPRAILPFVFDVLFLLWFGKPLERRFGSVDAAILVVVGMLVASGTFLVWDWNARHVTFGGTQSVVYAVLFCTACLAPKDTIYFNFLIPIPIWLLAIIYALFDLQVLRGGASTALQALVLSPLAAGLWGVLFAFLPLGVRRWQDFRRRRSFLRQRSSG